MLRSLTIGTLALGMTAARAPTGGACCQAGEGTRSATALLWSHAVLIRLAWTIQNGHPIDQQQVVSDRYLG
jgi:glucoamylase